MYKSINKETLRTELKAFTKTLIDGYVDDTTILELLGTDDVIDDYIDNQLKERWLINKCVLHSTDFFGKCFKCGEQVFTRRRK